jgi:hypothetical protein
LVSNVYESYFHYNKICQKDYIHFFIKGGPDNETWEGFNSTFMHLCGQHMIVFIKDVFLYLFDCIFTLSMFLGNTHTINNQD